MAKGASGNSLAVRVAIQALIGILEIVTTVMTQGATRKTTSRSYDAGRMRAKWRGLANAHQRMHLTSLCSTCSASTTFELKTRCNRSDASATAIAVRAISPRRSHEPE